ncbi:MAG: hypothetical protein AB4368_07305 [Xenococcaceae cyanobacterium]
MRAIFGDRYNYSAIFSLGILIGLSIMSCRDTKYAQCGQVIQIANNVVNEKIKLIDTQDSANIDSKTWLQVARKISQAAQNLEKIELQDPKLIKYQTDLARVYRIYSQATYDAVKAWENKNLQALQVAHTDVEKAGQWEEKLGKIINNYCGAATE